jgi:hypothetical protein
MKLAVITYGDAGYFEDSRNLPYVALESFRREFEGAADYYCVSTQDSIPAKASKLGFHYEKVDLPKIYSEDSYEHCNGSWSVRYPTEIYLFSVIPQHFKTLGYDYVLIVDGDTFCNNEFSLDFLDDTHCIYGVQEPIPETLALNTGVVFYNTAVCEQLNFSKLCAEMYGDKDVPYTADQPFINTLIGRHKLPIKFISYWHNFLFLNKKAYNRHKVRENLGFDPLKASVDDIIIGHFIQNQTQPSHTIVKSGRLVKEKNKDHKRNYPARNDLLAKWKILCNDIEKQFI